MIATACQDRSMTHRLEPPAPPRSLARRIRGAVVLTAVGLVLATSSALAADPVATAEQSTPAPLIRLVARPTSLLGAPVGIGVPSATSTTRRTVDVDWFRASAAVLQFRSYWCVPAVTQTMLNLIRGTADRSWTTQSHLYSELRAANLYRYTTRGNDVRGWARVLTAHLPTGFGYTDRMFDSRGAAITDLVNAMAATGRPGGIVVYHGTHAWTVVGYRYSEIPRQTSSRIVLGLYVVGPLGSPSDPWPQRYLTVSQLGSYMTTYHESTRRVIWEGKYVTVAPVRTSGQITMTR